MSVEKRRDGESAQRVCGERALGHKDGDSQTGEEYETVRGSSQSLCISQFTMIRARVVAVTTDNFTIELLTKNLYFSIVTHLSHGMPSFTSRFLGLVLPDPDHDCNTIMFLSSLSLARGQSFSKRKKVDGVTHVTKAHQLSKIR